MTMTRRAFSGGAACVATEPARAMGGLALDAGGFVDIGGLTHWIGYRGYDAKAPVMLFLHGGPGLGISHGTPAFDGWERTFRMAYWDMAHGGATHAKNMGRDQGPLSTERFVDDALAAAEHVRAATGAKKIALFGISFGSCVGLEMIRRRPDLFSVYVGTSQVVSGRRGARMGYDLGLAAAKARGDAAGVAALERVGPPPYRDVAHFMTRQAYTNPPGLPMTPADAAANAALAKLTRETPARTGPSIPTGLPAFNVLDQFMRVQSVMFQDSGRWESEARGLSFKVPVFVFQGTNDLNTPFPLAQEWMSKIRAPRKAFAALEGASHNTIPFHAELLALMRRHALPVIKA